jgi:hypothetical protein
MDTFTVCFHMMMGGVIGCLICWAVVAFKEWRDRD